MKIANYRTLIPLFKELRSERIIVRPYHESDAQSLFELNVRSAVVAQRLGFVQEARLRNEQLAADGVLRNTLIFALIPTDRT